MAKANKIPNYDRIELAIVKKLFSYGCWGKGHLLVIRLKKGIPKEDIGYIDSVLKELIKRQIVCIKKTKHGIAAFLNKEERKEIDKILLK